MFDTLYHLLLLYQPSSITYHDSLYVSLKLALINGVASAIVSFGGLIIVIFPEPVSKIIDLFDVWPNESLQ